MERSLRREDSVLDDSQVVERFAALYAALHETKRGVTLGVDLRVAPPNCLPKRMWVLLCDNDADDLTLLSVMRSSWLVHSSGIQKRVFENPPGDTWPDGFFLSSPVIKCAVTTTRIRYGVRLDLLWYQVIECPLIDFCNGASQAEITYTTTNDNQ